MVIFLYFKMIESIVFIWIIKNYIYNFPIIIKDDLTFIQQADLILLMDNMLSYGINKTNQYINLQILKVEFGVKIIMGYSLAENKYSKDKYLLDNLKDIIHAYKGTFALEEDCIKICFFNIEA